MTSPAADSSRSPPAGRRGPAVALLIGAVGAATAAAVVAGDGSPSLALAPVVAVSGAYLAFTARLRTSVSALMFALLAVDVSDDGMGIWNTPFVAIGDFLRKNLDETIHVPGGKITGMELIVLVLVLVWAWRKHFGAQVDPPGEERTLRVLRDFVFLYLASVLFALAVGMASGGSFAIWQVRRLAHVPLLFFLFHVAFRGPDVHRLLATIILSCAAIKAALAIWVQHVARVTTGGELGYGTNHGDSILFALAITILLVHAIERSGRLGSAALLLAALLWGTWANNRRLAWVQLGLGMGAVYLLTPARKWKRDLTKAVLVLAPVATLYVAAGWESGRGIFAPVRTLRSLTDSSTDRSTLWREVENWNISMSIRDRPLLGLGLGREYTEYMRNDDISGLYKEFRMWPHNFVLGLLLFGGLFGFTGIWSLFAILIFLAVRAYRRARAPDDRAAALCAIATALFCVVQAYGDLGAAFTQYRVLTALALAVTGKLVVATGALEAPSPVGPDGAGRLRFAPAAGRGG